MKKISVLIFSALLLTSICPVQAGIVATQKAKIEQNRIYKINYNDIKAVINQQTVYTNKYDLDGLSSL